MTDVIDKPDHQPDFDQPPRRRADRHLEQPAGERAWRRGAAGPGRGDRGGRRRRRDQGGRHPLRRPDLLRRRRHHRIRQAAGHAVAAERGRRDRELLQAGGRGDPRHGARRRARSGARLPLPDRGSRTRSSAFRRSSSACCRAPAARSGCRASPASRRRWRWCTSATPIGGQGRVSPSASSTASSRAICSSMPSRWPRKCATSARCPSRSERDDKLRGSARQSGDLRRIPQGQCPQVPRLRGAGSEHQGGRGGGRQALCRRRHRRAQPVHGVDERHPVQGAAIFLLRRAQGGQDRGHPRGHRAARRRRGSA